MKEATESASKKRNRYVVHRGEPGRNLVTAFENGQPTCEKPPLALAPPVPSSPPSPAPVQSEPESPGLSRNDQIAHYRASLISAFREEESKGTGSKRKFVNQFLKKFNSGDLFPEIYDGLFPKAGERGGSKSISSRTLYRWIKDFADAGIDGLVPQYGGVGNSKVTDHEKNVLLTLLLHQNRLKVGYGITLTKEWLKSKGIESPSSPATLRRFIDQFKRERYDIWTLRREGEKALNDKVLPYAERDWHVLNVGDGLVADGHRLNFQVIHPVTGKPCRAALVMFWDWKSSYPLGWEIMLQENVQCVASALRNAILALGKIPKWIYLDNGRAFKSKIFTEGVNLEDSELPGMFARLNINYHFAQPYNAQSKPIERIFGILNEQVERMIESYIGSSIDDKPAWTKRNEKLARSLHDPNNIPSIPEAAGYIRAWRDRYAEQPSRGRDGLRPIDIFNEGKGPGVDPAQLIYLMMAQEIKQVHRNGVTWLGWHWYDEILYGLKDRVIIRYSLSDLSRIYVFHKNEFLCTATPIDPVHPMVSESENPKDMEAVKQVTRLKKKVKSVTRKLCGLLETKAAAQIDWSRTRHEEIAEMIQKVEEAKKPKVISISPFLDEPKKVGEEAAEGAVVEESRTAEDHEGPLSCPHHYEMWEMYDWFRKSDPTKLNIADLAWMEEWGDRSLYLSLYRLEPDPKYLDYLQSVKDRWLQVKKDIVFDPTTGLIQPGDPEDSRIVCEWDVIRYGFYRVIESRFPGTLNDSSWKWIEEYQAGPDWRFFFSGLRNPRMYRPSEGD